MRNVFLEDVTHIIAVDTMPGWQIFTLVGNQFHWVKPLLPRRLHLMQPSCEAGCELSKSAVQLANIFPLGIQQFNLGTGIMGRWWVVGGTNTAVITWSLKVDIPR